MMRLQHLARTQDAPPAAELLGWAEAVARLQPDRDRAAFDAAKAQIAAALRRLAGSFRATR